MKWYEYCNNAWYLIGCVLMVAVLCAICIVFPYAALRDWRWSLPISAVLFVIIIGKIEYEIREARGQLND